MSCFIPFSITNADLQNLHKLQDIGLTSLSSEQHKLLRRVLEMVCHASRINHPMEFVLEPKGFSEGALEFLH